MKKFSYFLFAGLMVLVIYVYFAVQNRISVPVRFNFNDPKVYFLPLIMITSFVGGAVYGGVFTLIYKWTLAKEKRSNHNIVDYPIKNGTDDNYYEDNSGQAKPLVSPLDSTMTAPNHRLENGKRTT